MCDAYISGTPGSSSSAPCTSTAPSWSGSAPRRRGRTRARPKTPNLPTNIIPAKIARLKLPGESPMDVRFPPLGIKIMLEANPPKSLMLAGRLAVMPALPARGAGARWRCTPRPAFGSGPAFTGGVGESPWGRFPTHDSGKLHRESRDKS